MYYTVISTSSFLLTISASSIAYVKSFAYLGHIITTQQNDDDEIKNRRHDFIGQVNKMLCYFSKFSSSVRYKQCRAKGSSFYGCELWLLSNRI
jgi:hypothetical protein